MHTNFTHEQLQDPTIARADAMLRRCVHCGFCTATCPTYVLLGDERDSPRGRIYLMKEMFEQGSVTPPVTYHIDRCLSCLSCMTTCPSGVHYMHLVDHARAHIEKTFRRPLPDRLLRELLARILPYPARFRLALGLSRLDVIRKIALPSAMPDILSGMRVGLTIALILAVVGEMLASRPGLGQAILLAARSFQSADLYAGVILLGLIGYLSGTMLSLLEARLLRWRHRPA